MGIENRDYMRDGTSAFYGGGAGRSSAMQDIVKTLIIVNVIVFVGQILFQVPVISLAEYSNIMKKEFFQNELTDERIRKSYEAQCRSGEISKVSFLNQWFTLDSRKVLRGQIWRLTTYDFLHSTKGSNYFFHILFNMMILYMAGRSVAAKYGQREFLWFYLLSGIFSAVFYIVWGLLNSEQVAAVGASGAVSAVLVLFAMNWPQHRWYFYGVIPVPALLLVLITGGMDLLPMLKQLSEAERTDNIAHSAHIGGMLFGFLYFKANWSLDSYVPGNFSLKKLFQFKRKPKLRVHHPPATEEVETAPSRKPIPPEISKRVDELLDKINRSGEASLTDEERKFLHESSRKYR